MKILIELNKKDLRKLRLLLHTQFSGISYKIMEEPKHE